jgi:hypothetical protein
MPDKLIDRDRYRKLVRERSSRHAASWRWAQAA